MSEVTSKLSSPSKAGNLARRAWLWVVAVTLVIWIYPIAFQTTRILFVVGLASIWAGALFIWWRKKFVSMPLILIALIAAAVVSLPGRPVQTDILAHSYCSALTRFTGVRYLWGGESLLGIDCSDLVRQGMIWGELSHGLRTLNGRPIRHALALWWHDCSAKALRDGERGITRECFRAESIAQLEDARLQPGDLAVTADGIHVLAWLGDHHWIEADPSINRVVELTTPADNPWLQIPVVIVRWNSLEPSP